MIALVDRCLIYETTWSHTRHYKLDRLRVLTGYLGRQQGYVASDGDQIGELAGIDEEESGKKGHKGKKSYRERHFLRLFVLCGYSHGTRGVLYDHLAL